MYSPVLEGEPKSWRSMKYAFAINNSHNIVFSPDARDPTLSYFCHAIKILQATKRCRQIITFCVPFPSVQTEF